MSETRTVSYNIVSPFILSTAREETVYSTSSGLYPALSLEEAGNRAGGHIIMYLLRHLILVILWRAGGGIHFSPIFPLNTLE